jgi:hypothetical protein
MPATRGEDGGAELGDVDRANDGRGRRNRRVGPCRARQTARRIDRRQRRPQLGEMNLLDRGRPGGEDRIRPAERGGRLASAQGVDRAARSSVK